MTAADFIEEFGLLVDAPNGIQKLREIILQLAVQGKLVPQNPSDEPAESLLKKIADEKAQLLKTKAIRPSKTLPALNDDAVPHPIPIQWRWARLGEIGEYGTSAKVSPRDIPGGSWLLELEDIEKDTSRILQRLTFSDRESKSTKAHFRPGDVLYGKLRPYLNKVVVADSEGYCTTEIVPIRLYGEIDPFFMMTALKSPRFIAHVNELTYGVKMPRLGTDDARMTPVPIPPLAEQKRIVAKVDELMRLCDKVESTLKQSRAASEKLIASVVNHLTKAA